MKDFSSYSSFNSYCDRLDDRLLTQEEEKYYGSIIQDVDHPDRDAAINVMWEYNLRLVVKIVMDEFRSKDHILPINDIVSWGNIGLRKAVLKYDPKYGNKFSSYARFWIIKEIKREVDSQGGALGNLAIPSSAVLKVNKIRAAKWKFISQNGNSPTPEDIARMTNLTVGTVKSLAHMCDWKRTQVDFMGNNEYTTDVLFREEETVEEIHHMRRAMSHLPQIEALVLIMREGLDGGPKRNLEEVSKCIGKTRERARQIQNIAKAKLHKLMLDGIGKNTVELDYEKVIKGAKECVS